MNCETPSPASDEHQQKRQGTPATKAKPKILHRSPCAQKRKQGPNWPSALSQISKHGNKASRWPQPPLHHPKALVSAHSLGQGAGSGHRPLRQQEAQQRGMVQVLKSRGSKWDRFPHRKKWLIANLKYKPGKRPLGSSTARRKLTKTSTLIRSCLHLYLAEKCSPAGMLPM